MTADIILQLLFMAQHEIVINVAVLSQYEVSVPECAETQGIPLIIWRISHIDYT